MIKQVYIKDNLSIKEVKIELKSGLNVFSGPSGAGKSIFFESILSLFGLKEFLGNLAELELEAKLILDEYGIELEDEHIYIKAIKKEKIRYFINNQSISKKQLKEAFSSLVKYLALKDSNEFESKNLLELLDAIIIKEKPQYKELLKEYKEFFRSLKENQEKLQKIEEEEKKIEELKEFAAFEIQKIDAISPKIGEYEELLEQKKALSKKDKILSAINSASKIFEAHRFAREALLLLEQDSSFLDTALNELKNIFESELEKLQELENIEIEKLLDRLEKLSMLKKKYGSIEETLIYKKKKKMELEHYNNISSEKENLKKLIDELNKKTEELANKIAQEREKIKPIFEQKLNNYLLALHLKEASLQLSKIDLNEFGANKAELFLGTNVISNISSGEFNRLRLALLALKLEFFNQKGILILDEIDANLSGAESFGIAHLLKLISKNYQILVISHQPHLPALADTHFLVKKIDELTIISELFGDERIKEIARTISGKEINSEAIEFAKKLLEQNG